MNNLLQIGLTGPTGERGPIGLQGLQGVQGFQGVRGDRGDKGNTGDKGFKGDKGDRGIQGPQGLQGIQGLKGDKGDKGDTGLQGIQGLQGLKGDKGDSGLHIIQSEIGNLSNIQSENSNYLYYNTNSNQLLSSNTLNINKNISVKTFFISAQPLAINPDGWTEFIQPPMYYNISDFNCFYNVIYTDGVAFPFFNDTWYIHSVTIINIDKNLNDSSSFKIFKPIVYGVIGFSWDSNVVKVNRQTLSNNGMTSISYLENKIGSIEVIYDKSTSIYTIIPLTN
jgi:hypothetical protein